MKKKLSLALIISSVALVLGTTAGINNYVKSQNAEPAEASTTTTVNQVYFDVPTTSARWFTVSETDPQTLYYSTMTQCTDSDFRNTYTSRYVTGAGNFDVALRDSKQFDALYFPVRCYVPNVPAYSTVNFNTITISFSLVKNASGGAAPAYLEVFDQDESWTPNAFSLSENSQSNNAVVHLRTTTKNSAVSQSYLFQNKTKYNTGNGLNHIWFSFGVLLVGCYGSSYSNHAQVTATVTNTVCNYNTNDIRVIHSNNQFNMYTDYNVHNAISDYNSNPGSTFQLLNDVTVTSALTTYNTFSASGTIDLNGHTFTKDASTAGISIINNSTVTIKGGTLTHTRNYSTLTIADGCTVTVNSDVTVSNSSSGHPIYNSGTCILKGTARSTGTSAIYNYTNATLQVNSGASIVCQGKDSSNNSYPCIHNYGGTVYVNNCSFSIYNNTHPCIFNQTGSLFIYGNSFTNLNHVKAVTGAKTYLYYNTTRYSGNVIKFSFYADASATSLQKFSDSRELVYLKQSNDQTYVNLQNTMENYINVETVYDNANQYYVYRTTYTKFTLSVVASNCAATPTATSNIIYTDTVRINITLNTGYTLSTANISRTGTFTFSFNQETCVITLTKISSNMTITITPVLQTLSLAYNGNGTNSYTSNVDKEGYITINPTYSVTYGDEITVLNNAFRRDGYYFTGWNTAEDGSGQDYAAGDTFTITDNMVLYAQWIEADYAILDAFVSDYMHMNYNQNLGYCKSYNGGDGYYVIAKHQLVTFDDATINVFRTDTRYYNARTRYEKWAEINNDLEYAYVDDFTHISQSNRNIMGMKENGVAVIVVTSIIVASSCLCFALLAIKKRKEEK